MTTSSQITQNTIIDAFDTNCYSGTTTWAVQNYAMEPASPSINSCATLTAVTLYVRADGKWTITDESDQASWRFRHGTASGVGSQCSGHTTSPNTTTGRTCGTTGFTLRSFACAHTGTWETVAGYNTNGGAWNSAEVYAIDPGVTWYFNYYYNIITYYDSVPSQAGDPTKNAATTSSITINKPATPGSQGVTHWNGRIGGVSSADIVVATTTHSRSSGLAAGTGYTCEARFKNTCGALYGAWNATPPTFYTLPTVVSTPTVARTASNQITVSWTNVTGGNTYRVRRATNTEFTLGVTVLTTTDGGTPYVDSTVTDDNHVTQYFYRVTAKNVDEEYGAESSSSLGIYAHATPATTSAPAVAATAVGTLNVDKPSALSTYADGWRIYDSTDSYTAVQATRTLAQTDWDDSGIGNGTTRDYKVAYYNDVAEGIKSAASTPDTTWNFPTAGTTPTISTQTTTTISFAWGIHGDGGGTPASALTEYHYNINTFTPPTSHYDTNALTLSNVVGDNGEGEGSLSPGTFYYFKVHANNAVGTGADTAEKGGWTLCATPANPGVVPDAVGQLAVTWAVVTGVNTWDVEWSADGTSGWAAVTGSPFASAVLNFDDTAMGNGTTRYYRVRANNLDGNPSAYTPNSIGNTTWTVPGAPTNVGATTP